MSAYQTILIWVLIFGVAFGLALLSHISKKLDTIIEILRSEKQ